MINFNWKIVIIVLIALVIADKAITVANIQAVKKNFPKIDPLKIEKNPIAKLFFTKFGLLYGTILYGIISIITTLIFILLLNWTLGLFLIPNSLSISLYVTMLWFGFVITNNVYFLLKFSKLIP